MSQAVMQDSHKRDVQEKTGIHITPCLWLTVPVAIGTFIVTIAGIIHPRIYGNSESLAAQGQAQDLITLILVLPALLVSMWYTAHASISGRIIWLSTMLYFAYTYAISAFQVEFNQLFLLYVMILGSAFYAIVLGFMSIKPDDVRFRFSVKAPVRMVSIISAFIAIAYYGLWLSDVLPSTLNNIPPAVVITDNIPTSAVHVLDMGFYLPLLLVGAVLLWQRKPMGVVITGTALAFGSLMGVAVSAMVINMALWGLVDSIEPVVIFAITTILTGGLLLWLLNYIEN